MDVRFTQASVRSILTRASGYLEEVCSHSLQPYRGCGFGRSLCGVACYVQHNRWLVRDAVWGSFVEARVNAADVYREQVERERRWARRRNGEFSIFLSSSTDPFLPQERRAGITSRVLAAMRDDPPDTLIVQTHTHAVLDHQDALCALAERCALRVHVSIESDRDRLPGLPAPASPVHRRFAAASSLKAAGLRTVVTAAPLLPIADPRAFFERVATCADAVVIDHFIGGDGSTDGSRTRRTALPTAMEATLPGSTRLSYRDQMVAVAREILPGRVGVGADGFAGRMLQDGAP